MDRCGIAGVGSPVVRRCKAQGLPSREIGKLMVL
jgi:hypothetical protein